MKILSIKFDPNWTSAVPKHIGKDETSFLYDKYFKITFEYYGRIKTTFLHTSVGFDYNGIQVFFQFLNDNANPDHILNGAYVVSNDTNNKCKIKNSQASLDILDPYIKGFKIIFPSKGKK